MSDQHGSAGGSWDGGWDGPVTPPPDPGQRGQSTPPVSGPGLPPPPAWTPPAPPAGLPAGAAAPEPVFEIAPPAEPPAARRRHPALLAGVSAGAVVALVLAGAGVRQLVHLASDSAAPAGFAPASTFAYAQVHLAPSAEQRVALFDFSRKFPGSPTRAGGASADQVVSTLLKGVLKNTPVIYDVDIKPWLGDYAAVAGFTDSAGKPQVLGIVGVKNKSSATTALTRVERAAHLAYTFDGGYALIAQNQSVLNAATSELKGQSLAHSASFSSDFATLPSGELVEGWTDLNKVASIAKALPGCAAQSSSRGCVPASLRGLLGQQLDQSKGRVVFGMSVTAGYAQITMRSRGATQAPVQVAVGSAVGALPDDSAVAVGIGSPDRILASYATALDKVSSSGALSALRPGLQLPQITQAIKEATGLSFPRDFETLLGSRVVVSASHVGTTSHGGTPLVAARTHPSDVAAAQRLAQQVVDRFGGSVPVTVQRAGADLVVADSKAYADEVARGGHLAEQQLFRMALGTDVAGATDVVFVDLKAIDAKAPFSAVGVTLHRDGRDEVVQARIVG